MPAEGQGGVTLSCVPSTATDFASGDVVKEEKRGHWWCAVCGGQYNWKDLNMLVVQDSADPREAKAAPRTLCGT